VPASSSQRVQALAFRTLEAAVASRSWDRRVALGTTVGRLWHALDGWHRRVARDNVRAAYPEWAAGRAVDLVRANFEHLGITTAEFLGIAGETPDSLLARCDFQGLEYLEAALAQRRGVLLLTGHVGNWELQSLAGGALGYATYGVARRIKNPLVNDRVLALRERFGARVIPHRNAVRPILKALKTGGVVGFLLDQKASAREGVLSEFFGRPVSTNQGLALLALKSGAPVLSCFARRVSGGHRIQVGPAIPPPAEGEREARVCALTRSFDATIEAAVRACPEQWFWVHRRWRVPRELLP